MTCSRPLPLPSPPPQHPPTLYLSCSFLTFFVADTLSDLFFLSFLILSLSFSILEFVLLCIDPVLSPNHKILSFFVRITRFFLSFVFSSFFSSFFLFFLLAFFSIHLSHAFRFLGNRPRLDRFFPAAGAGACLFRQDTDWLVFGKRSSLQERNNN